MSISRFYALPKYFCKPATKGMVWIYDNPSQEKIGLATINGKVLIEPCYGKVEPFVNGFAKVNNGYWYDYEDEDERPRVSYRKFSMGQWGVINSLGELVIPIEYDSIQIEDDSTFTVSRTLGWHHVSGRLDKDGNLTIKDENGKDIIASKKYDWQEDFNAEGYSTVYYKNEVGTINNKFQFLIPFPSKNNDIPSPQKDEDLPFLTEFEDAPCLALNKNMISIPEKFTWGRYLTEDIFIGIKDGKEGLYGYSGVEYIPSIYQQIQSIGYDLFAAQESSGKFKVLNRNGKIVNEQLFDKIYLFGERSKNVDGYDERKPVENALYTIVLKGDLYGAINRLGKLVVPIQYAQLYYVNKHIFWCGKGCYMDITGKRVAVLQEDSILVPEKYEQAWLLDNSLLLVRQCGLYGCINQKGDIIIPIQYDELTYSDNMFTAKKYDQETKTITRGVINVLNKEIIPFNNTYDDININNGLIIYRVGGKCGAYTNGGKLVCEPKYSQIKPITNYIIKVGVTDYAWTNKMYWGLINIDGDDVFPNNEYNYPDADFWLHKECIRYTLGGNLIGCLDITGHEILEPKYKEIKDFVDGYAIVSRPSYYDENGFHYDQEISKYGVIDTSFNEIIPCVFNTMEYIKDLGLFKTEFGYKTIDGRYMTEVDNGDVLLLDAKYKYCEPFIDTCAIAIQTTETKIHYGLINKKGEDILSPIYQWLKRLDNGLYKFKLNDLYGLMDAKGNVIVPNKYYSIGKFEDNLAMTFIKTGENEYGENLYLYGCIDNQGNEILPPDYEYMGKRSEEKIVVMKNKIWGLFDARNLQLNLILNISYLGIYKEGLCRFNTRGDFDKTTKKIVGGSWGYMDCNGNIIIEAQYEESKKFSEGLAAIKKDGKWGFINTEGEIVVPCKYDSVDFNFIEGRGGLIKNNEIFVFDNTGNHIDTYIRTKEHNYDSYSHDDFNVYDNPHYNDNLDMDQQSIEFWNNL